MLLSHENISRMPDQNTRTMFNRNSTNLSQMGRSIKKVRKSKIRSPQEVFSFSSGEVHPVPARVFAKTAQTSEILLQHTSSEAEADCAPDNNHDRLFDPLDPVTEEYMLTGIVCLIAHDCAF